MDGVNFDKVAPVVPVVDLDAALDRYRRLGFTVAPFRIPHLSSFGSLSVRA